MPCLIGLPGMGKKIIEAERFNTPRQAVKILGNGLAACTAGESGAINVWIDRKGQIRAHVCAFLQVTDSVICDDMGCLTAWLKPRLLQIRKPNIEARAQAQRASDDRVDLLGRRI